VVGGTPPLSQAQFTALRYFTLDGTDHASHTEQGRMIRRYIAWRNRHTHDPLQISGPGICTYSCVHPGRRSERRLVGPALVLPERLLPAAGRGIK
jgi:hypothetical protein